MMQYLHDEFLYSNKNEQITTTCINMLESHKYSVK